MTVGYLGMGRIGQALAERAARLRHAAASTSTKPQPLPAARERELGLERVGFDALLARARPADAARAADAGHPPHRRPRGDREDEAGRADRQHRARRPDRRASRWPRRWPTAGSAAPASTCSRSEPPAPSDPLLALRNVVVTPHISAGTRDALGVKMRAVFANVLRFYAGEPLANPVSLP